MGIFVFSVLKEDDPRATDDSGHRDEMYTADSSHTHNPLLSSDAFGCFEVLQRSKTHLK